MDNFHAQMKHEQGRDQELHQLTEERVLLQKDAICCCHLRFERRNGNLIMAAKASQKRLHRIQWPGGEASECKAKEDLLLVFVGPSL